MDAQILDLVKNKITGSPHGISAIFIPISEKWGLKLFRWEHERNGAYENQSLFLSYGLAPELGDKITLPDEIQCGKKKYKFGYFTEIIETLIPGRTEDMTEEQEEARDDLCDELELFWGNECESDSKIEQKIKEWEELTGERAYDMHVGNLGIKNGVLMPLDFGW